MNSWKNSQRNLWAISRKKSWVILWGTPGEICWRISKKFLKFIHGNSWKKSKSNYVRVTLWIPAEICENISGVKPRVITRRIFLGIPGENLLSNIFLINPFSVRQVIFVGVHLQFLLIFFQEFYQQFHRDLIKELF